jgi:glutamine---fructose-6-phosphate transaminase (isomerizing)
MPVSLVSEIAGQPEALRALVRFYLAGEGQSLLEAIPDLLRQQGPQPVFTGMGASYHAAWTGALHLNSLGIPAAHVEASDLLLYSHASLDEKAPIVYFSQSGASAEVEPLLKILAGRPVIAVTNDPGSPLAAGAVLALPLLAGEEAWVASKTYLNSLALAWLLGTCLAGRPLSPALQELNHLAGRCQAILDGSDAEAALWSGYFDQAELLIFTGHGPHAATARQAAMLVSEWAKRPAVYASAGGFRHGFIEMVRPGAGAVVFAPPGRSPASGQALARELAGYGLEVMVVAQGISFQPGEPQAGDAPFDEFLSPILDILPVQVFVDRLAIQRGIQPGFRRIEKVVNRL